MTDDILRRLQELNERGDDRQWALTWVTYAGDPFWEIVDISDLVHAVDSAMGATPEEAYRELLNWFYGESADD